MFNKKQIIFTTAKEGDIKEMYLSIFEQLSTLQNIIKITFFHLPHSNSDYIQNAEHLQSCVKESFDCDAPVVSYVAQKPFESSLIAEVLILDEEGVTIKRAQEYIVLKKGNKREIVTAGIFCKNLNCSAKEQSENIFSRINTIFDHERFYINDIYRQWNYICDITEEQNGVQNYQEFNDARSLFYSKAEWTNGYPAATGIGQSKGGIMVEVFAANGEGVNIPIDNPMQIAAHNYSQNVLAGNNSGKSTPKFERARLFNENIYISGTAAIKGEDSICSNDSVIQTATTMEIMDCLVSPANIAVKVKDSVYSALRIYVKQENDIKAIKEFMEQNYPAPQKIYLQCDICRSELLVEIEGIGYIL
ncbi:MAG: PTS cellobiose transporter subunit IIC [Bacteroidaceae bacterium]|nr:PTS cellobiose transporter subunit IIC [Bacteroidaceae bacterium]